MDRKQKLIIRLNEELKQYQADTRLGAKQKCTAVHLSSMSLEDIRLIIEALHGDVYGEELDNYDNDGARPEIKAPELDC